MSGSTFTQIAIVMVVGGVLAAVIAAVVKISKKDTP